MTELFKQYAGVVTASIVGICIMALLFVGNSGVFGIAKEREASVETGNEIINTNVSDAASGEMLGIAFNQRPSGCGKFKSDGSRYELKKYFDVMEPTGGVTLKKMKIVSVKDKNDTEILSDTNSENNFEFPESGKYKITVSITDSKKRITRHEFYVPVN